MKLTLFKYHALGNDYFVFDPKLNPLVPSDFDKVAFSKRLCHRHHGLGSDGVLIGPYSHNPFRFQIFNPDGSEAEKSGNGLRIFGSYLLRAGYISSEIPSFAVATPYALATLFPVSKTTCDVDMGPFTILSPSQHFDGYDFSCVNGGNPHAVAFVDHPSKELIQAIGPLVENHEFFVPNRTNVQMAHVIDRKTIVLEIWERGAGYTLSSGSSASAVFAAARHKKLVDAEVTCIMPGGHMLLSLTSEGHILLKGDVCFVGKIIWEIND